MLVQLSPWKTAQTSIRFSKSQRRRKRDGKDFTEFPVDASFVTTSSRRGQQKMKKHSVEFSDSMPLLAITSDHRITVVGRSKEPSYQEYAALQYASRPGNAGSFFSAPANGKSSADLPKIPAILDAKNDWVYAIQHGNARLCCWHSLHSSGPDEKNSLKVELSHPALSMSLLPLHKGIVYGTCQNGTIFIARVVSDSDDSEVISVEYISSKQPSGSKHIGTLAELPQGQAKTTGKKRKMSDADGNSPVVFYQAFCDGESVSLVRHEVMCERFSGDGKLVIEGSLSQQVSSINLASETGGSKNKVGKAKLLVSSFGTAPKVAILYTIQAGSPLPKNGNSDSTEKYYCAVLSLSTGDVSHNPVPLPLATKQYGLVTEKLLVVATQEVLSLYDLETGSMLHSTNMANVVGDLTDDWLLCTDAKLSTIGVLFPKDGHIHAAFSVANSDESREALLDAKLNLASKLSSSLISSSMHPATGHVGVPHVVNNLLKIDNELETSRPGALLEGSVRKALTALDEARSKIHASDNGSNGSILLDAYETSVSTLLNEMKNSNTVNEGNVAQYNPQDALPSSDSTKPQVDKMSQKKQLNGVHSSQHAHDRANTPSSLPQSFIDGALRIVLALLQSGKAEDTAFTLERLDAVFILCRLLQTGKVSARLHFEGTDSIQESNEDHLLLSALRSVKLSDKRGRRVFSPVDMIHEVLRNCPDLSERQLVVMLNYMMRRSLPDDIAEVFMEAKNLDAQHPYKKLSRKFIAARNKQQKLVQDKTELDSVSRKLIIAGTAFVLRQIVSYSQCNEAMLRVALLEELATRDEAIILAKLLSDVLTFTPREIGSRYKPNQNNFKSTCHWVSALCDSFQDDLSEAQISDGENYLIFLLRSVTSAIKHSEAILSLREEISRGLSQKEVNFGGKGKNAIPMEITSLSGGEEIPGYSVDRIVF